MSYTIFPDGHTGDALADVWHERHRQDHLVETGKFAHTAASLELDNARCFAILIEECGEVARSFLDNAESIESLEELRTELVQVAAVAVAWAERCRKLQQRLRKEGRANG